MTTLWGRNYYPCFAVEGNKGFRVESHGSHTSVQWERWDAMPMHLFSVPPCLSRYPGHHCSTSYLWIIWLLQQCFVKHDYSYVLAPPFRKWKIFPHPLNSGWPCNLLRSSYQLYFMPSKNWPQDALKFPISFSRNIADSLWGSLGWNTMWRERPSRIKHSSFLRCMTAAH